MTEFVLRDVTLRDGLQLTGRLLPTERKVRLARALLDLGVQQLEIGAMARPDLVPPMADTVHVIESLSPDELDRCWVWVATPSGARRALAAGARHLQYCFSATDGHNLANVGRTTEASLDALPEVIGEAQEAGADVQLTLATSFTCPFEGPVAPERVLALVTDERTEGTVSTAICDTLGQASPGEVSALTAEVRAATPADRALLFHGHDTWGLGVANGIAALEAGADALDASVAGLGGCPFAPGASGNTATEDLLFALRPSWFGPDGFAALRELNRELTEALGEPDRSRAVTAADRTPPDAPFVWSRSRP